MIRTAMRMPEFKDRPAEEVAGTLLDLFLKGAGKGHAQCGQAGPSPSGGAPSSP
jgi:hypothetical protein